MVEPDFYLPAVWSLDSANVQAIESSATDPKVRMDSTGLSVTDSTGAKQVVITGDGEPVDGGGSPLPGWVPGSVVLLDHNGLRLPTQEGLFGLFKRNQQIRWERQDGSGAVVASIGSLYDPSPIVGERLTLTSASPSASPASIRLNTTTAAGAGASAILLSSDGVSDFALLSRVLGGSFNGPWNGTTKFSATVPPGNYRVLFSCSGWGSIVGLTGITLFANGVNIGQNAMYLNQAGVHTTFPPAVLAFTVNAPGGTVNFALSNGANAVSDSNDQGMVLLIPSA